MPISISVGVGPCDPEPGVANAGAPPSGPGGAGSPIGLLLALTKAA